jgi:ABC-type Fe3+-hydroxamate transport system substrate-binding protein
VLHDDLGSEVPLEGDRLRVVSLVPSLTESLAPTGRLVGATDWCTHPADLDVVRVRGTKNPDLAAIRELEPDLVIANKEENRELDVRRLRESGVPVWVTGIESVTEALASLRRLFAEALEVSIPTWVEEAEGAWAQAAPARGRVAVPIWRDPWMVVGPRTFTGDLLRRAGLVNAFEEGEDRYPHVELEALDRADLDVVLLPDEPYVFTPADGPEAFSAVGTQLISGRLLTWYGPSLVEARAVLDGILR